jgi:3D (Asp-Asp-Asp) domain-containing protein
MEIEIMRSQATQVIVDDQVLDVRVRGQKVSQALSQSGITLHGMDYAVPSVDQPIPLNRLIRVVRVSVQVQIEQEPLPFFTLFQPLPEFEIDNQQLLQAGAFGVLANRIRIRHEDGEPVSTVTEGEWVAREPEPEILGYGTGIVIRTVNTADGNLEYWRAVEMWATSYSPANAGIPEDHPWYGITASGKPLRKGLVAIDRSLIPFGTMMYVPGYGFAEAADTGGGVKGRWIDLGYLDPEYVPWHSWVTVYFLTPVPPAENIVWIFP